MTRLVRPHDRDRLLVLDAGNVLVLDTARATIHELARRGGHDPAAYNSEYRRTIKHPLLKGTGGTDEAAFWRWVRQTTGITDDDDSLHNWLVSTELALPASARVAVWASACTIRVLSNHVGTWLRPRLEDLGILTHLDSCLISNERGWLKPEMRAFEEGFANWPPERVLYVDDKEQNLIAAATLGVATLLADLNGHWLAAVDSWLLSPVVRQPRTQIGSPDQGGREGV